MMNIPILNFEYLQQKSFKHTLVGQSVMSMMVRLCLVLFLLSSCDSIPFVSSDEEEGPVRYELELKTEQIGQLSELEAIFKITNVSDKKQTFSFSTGCQHGYTLAQGEEIIYDSMQNIMCIQALTSFTLKPEDVQTFDISLKDTEELEPLEQGTYQLNTFLLNDQSPVVSQSFQIQ